MLARIGRHTPGAKAPLLWRSRDAKSEALAYLEATATASARARRRKLYIPTHRDEDAMNGAPVRLWLVKRKQATATAKYGGLSTPRRTMKLSGASVEMT